MKFRDYIIVLAILCLAIAGCTTHEIVTAEDSPEPVEMFQVGLTYPIVSYSGIDPVDTSLTRLMHIEYGVDSTWQWMEFAGDDGQMFYVHNGDAEYQIITETAAKIDTVITQLIHIEYSVDSSWQWMEFAGDNGQVFIIHNGRTE